MEAMLSVPTPMTDSRPNTATDRTHQAMLVRRLHHALLRASSATRVLEEWCTTYLGASEPRIAVDVATRLSVPADESVRSRLKVDDAGRIAYRRVRLIWEDRVLSEADNWYVPERLTVRMNTALEASTEPFGRVIAALKPYRTNVRASVLWQPDSQSATPEQPIVVPDEILRHEALLYSLRGDPLAEVHERYRRDVLP